MIIHFKKGKKGIDILECHRPDGSMTWTRVRPRLMAHELLHYAVETTFGIRNGFFGLLQAGHGIEEFETDRSRRKTELLPANLPVEAQVSEIIVGVMQTEINEPMEDLRGEIRKILTLRGIPFEALDRLDFEKGRVIFRRLYDQWNRLEPGEQLTLEFESGALPG
jgi:hypothetical protein